MRKLLIIILLMFMIQTGAIMANSEFILKSNSIKNGEVLKNSQVLNGFGCTGENISPDLAWSGAPQGTKSCALLVHDPDAPKENGWWHWLVVNIPINKTSFSAGEKLEKPMLETITDFKTTGYGGACPPIGHGIHHYNFTIHALDVESLNISANLDPNEVEKIVKSHSIASSTICAIYQR